MWKALGKGDWIFLGVWKMSEFFVCTLHPGSLGELEKPDLANTASLTCSTPAVVLPSLPGSSTTQHPRCGGKAALLLSPTAAMISVKDGAGAAVHIPAPSSPREDIKPLAIFICYIGVMSCKVNIKGLIIINALQSGWI